jgi:hypothetical protein
MADQFPDVRAGQQLPDDAGTLERNSKMHPTKTLAASLVLLAVMTAVAAQRPAAQAPALTALDYHEIEQLNAQFCHGLDSAAEGGFQFANAFTADGVYIDASGRVYQGREQLAALARQDPESTKGPTNVRHYVTSTMVEPTAAGAAAKGYLMVAATRVNTRPGGALDAGQYWDDLVRTADGWRIARRTLVRATERPSAAAATSAVTTRAAAAPSSTKAPRLSAQDYTDIQQLYARYSFAWDGILDDGRAWIALFTPDGIHINETADPRQFFRGRDALLGFALQRRLQDNRVPERVNHFITNMLLEPTADGVTAKPYLLRVNIQREGQPGSTITAGGIYFDYLVKTADGWRFAHKNFMTPNAPLPETAKRRMNSAPSPR